jgi:hypothetical protein
MLEQAVSSAEAASASPLRNITCIEKSPNRRAQSQAAAPPIAIC